MIAMGTWLTEVSLLIYSKSIPLIFWILTPYKTVFYNRYCASEYFISTI